MTRDHTDYLVQDIADMFDAGEVGLYEFIWTLRTIDPTLSLREMRRQSREALSRLLERDDLALVRLKWASQDWLEPYSWARLSDSDWDDPTDHPYVAVIPVANISRYGPHRSPAAQE